MSEFITDGTSKFFQCPLSLQICSNSA